MIEHGRRWVIPKTGQSHRSTPAFARHDPADDIRQEAVYWRDEAFKMAAGTCKYRGGDDYGNPYCFKHKHPLA